VSKLTAITAIVVYSGGMDSFTTLHKAIEDEGGANHIMALSFNYGQRHKKELEYAIRECARLGVLHRVIPLDFGAMLSGSALTSAIEVPLGHYEEPSMKQTVVPNRNMIMLSIAAGIAVAENVGRLYCGVHDGDHAIYPDCRPEFIDAMNSVLAIANYTPVKIIAPWLGGTKVSILEWGLEAGLNYGDSWTCYNGREHACGKCGSCQERLEAFEALGAMDPLEYETDPVV